MKENKYYFEFVVYFKSDYDLKEFERVVGKKAAKMTPKSESKMKDKSALITFKTPLLDDIYTDNEFDKYILEFKPKFEEIKKAICENDGECHFCIVFEQCSGKPCLGFNKDTVKACGELGAALYFDFNY